MSYMLPHLHNGWQVDQAILSEEDRVLVIRFGHDWDPTCMKMDEVLYSIAEKVKNFAVIYLVDITEVPDFNKMYELYDPCTVMFFFRWFQKIIEKDSKSVFVPWTEFLCCACQAFASIFANALLTHRVMC
uniref:Thioredoxin-like 4A n=1 Tax=Esox lucius TaxID=8010 RepID=A0AAY5K962_ESOLU